MQSNIQYVDEATTYVDEANNNNGEAQAPLQVSINEKGFLPSYIKRKIIPHFADLNNLPKHMDNPLWQEIQTVCGLTLPEMVRVMNARCKCQQPSHEPMGQPLTKAELLSLTRHNKKVKKSPALHFTNLYFDVIITICEILDIDTLLSLYLALKKYVPLNPRNTSSAIEGLTWVINKKLDAMKVTIRGNKPERFVHPCYGLNTTATHILRNLAKYDTIDLSNEILNHICYLSGQDITKYISNLIADYTVNFNTPGLKQASKSLNREFGMVRQNKMLADQLRVIMVRSVCNNLEKKMGPFYNEVLIDESGNTPNCFAHPIHILQQIVKKMSQEQLVPFAKHVHTGLQANIKTLRRIKVPEKVGVLAKKVELKQQAMNVVLEALKESDLKKELAACYVKVESYSHMEAEARKNKIESDARRKKRRADWQAYAQAQQARAQQAQQAQQAQAQAQLHAQQAHQIQMFQDYQLPPPPQQTLAEEEEEEELKVTPFHHQGRDYYKGIDSEIIYDVESQEAIGIWDGTQIVAIV